MKRVRRRHIELIVVGLALLGSTLTALAGCATGPIPPTYTQEELRRQCERQGSGWWHPDDLTGGYCEPIHS